MASGEGDTKPVNVDDDVDHDFAHKLDEIINHNATGLSLSIGYRVGLVQTMVELKEPKTSIEIAETAGLNERLLLIRVPNFYFLHCVHVLFFDFIFLLPKFQVSGASVNIKFLCKPFQPRLHSL